MTEVNFSYQEAELAWVSDTFTLTGDIRLYVKLKEEGIIIIRKANSADGESPKASLSTPTTEAEYLIDGETNGKILTLATSTEPEYIKYENINK